MAKFPFFLALKANFSYVLRHDRNHYVFVASVSIVDSSLPALGPL